MTPHTVLGSNIKSHCPPTRNISNFQGFQSSKKSKSHPHFLSPLLVVIHCRLSLSPSRVSPRSEAMSLRPSERTEVRRNRYKVAVDADDGRRRRENNMIEIRKSKREESLQKKRREGMPSQNSILSLQSSVIEKKLETLPAMLAGVYTDDNNMQLEATTQFRKLLSIERSPPIEEVIQAGVVPRLVEFLMRSDFPQLQFEAAWALTNIASGTSENTKGVIDHGAVPIFVQLLQAMSDDVREQTRPSLPALERLIHSSDEEVLTDACWALSYLSDGTNDKIQAVIESGVCNRLVELLMHPSPSVLIPALSTVGNIVTGDDTQTQSMAETSFLSPEGPSASDDEIRDLEVSRAQNNNKRLRKDSDAGKKRGVCYLSRVPPHMDPTRLRQILSQYGDIHRIYLVSEITLETLVEVTVPLSSMRKLIQL